MTNLHSTLFFIPSSGSFTQHHLFRIDQLEKNVLGMRIALLKLSEGGWYTGMSGGFLGEIISAIE